MGAMSTDVLSCWVTDIHFYFGQLLRYSVIFAMDAGACFFASSASHCDALLNTKAASSEFCLPPHASCVQTER